jgi:homospermidine synthase
LPRRKESKNKDKREKPPQSSTTLSNRGVNPGSPMICFFATQLNVNLRSHHRTNPGVEQQIISTIKTFRNHYLKGFVI